MRADAAAQPEQCAHLTPFESMSQSQDSDTQTQDLRGQAQVGCRSAKLVTEQPGRQSAVRPRILEATQRRPQQHRVALDVLEV